MPNSKQDFNDILNAISASGKEDEGVRDEDLGWGGRFRGKLPVMWLKWPPNDIFFLLFELTIVLSALKYTWFNIKIVRLEFYFFFVPFIYFF